jgi:hypothetical protein
MRTLSLFMGFLCVLVFLVPMNAQDFGFGFAEEDAESASAPASSSAAPTPSVNISGEVSAKLLGYVNDFSSFSEMKNTTLGDVFAGKLNVSASAFNAEGVINLKLAPVFNGSASPVKIDEAYLRAYFGDFSIEGGLRKLTWGKADSFGPLDVVNPMDYTDLIEITNLLGRKIARPLVHASYRLGAFSKLEGVLVPWFEGHRFADSGRWTPWQLRDLPDLMKADVAAYVINTAPAGLPSTVISDVLNTIRNYPVQLTYPSTLTLEYAQAGLRFTTTVASSDLGVQYYFGRLPRPAVMLRGLDTFWQHFDPETKEFTGSITPHSDYNGYHQIGLDYAQVIGGFNLRTELAAIITGDLSGDDGSVYNPSIAWSLGFSIILGGCPGLQLC